MKNNSKNIELLRALGLAEHRDSPFVNEQATPDTAHGRVIIHHGNHAEVALIAGEEIREETVRLSPYLETKSVAGDWVAVVGGAIEQIAPRYTELARPAADGIGEQALASNIDAVLLVVSLEKPPSLKAIEKLLIMGWDSGATPVLVLSKTDLCPDVTGEISRIETVAVGVETLCCSASTGEGMERLQALTADGTTTMLGASGAGKTTLLNALNNADAATAPVRRDGQGRHTTTTRKLYMLPGGGVILDIPGIRTLSLSASDEAVEETFADIATLAQHCRFGDCSHTGDFGCAVQAAVDAGELPARRLESWQGVQRELAYQRRRNNPQELAEQKRVWKQLTKNARKSR